MKFVYDTVKFFFPRFNLDNNESTIKFIYLYT